MQDIVSDKADIGSCTDEGETPRLAVRSDQVKLAVTNYLSFPKTRKTWNKLATGGRKKKGRRRSERRSVV